MQDLLSVLTVIAALGCGIIGGIFFGFSNFIMQALALVKPRCGIAAMQEINRTVLNPGFLGFFFGTAVVCLVLAVLALWQGSATSLLLAGCACYVIGTFGVTVVCNVPRNEALDRGDIEWETYLREWTHWNRVRTIAALVGAVLLMFALG
ncbi:MAG: anthrone oxygenase family protein [Planctomycetota bacterium]|jgi:uncharacterized membrane protein